MPRNPAALTVKGPRIEREKRTVTAMIELFCNDQHAGKPGELCPQCSDIHAYAMQRLERCPFQEGKTTCANCAVHCYRPERKEQIRAVMRHAGPRMIWKHPVMAVRHLLDGRRKHAILAPKPAPKPAQPPAL